MLAITPFTEIELPPARAAEANTPAKIISFGDLPVGWHYGDGGPPASSAIDLALDLYWLLLWLGYKQTDAFPGIHGEVMIAGYGGPRYVELIAESDGCVSVHLELSGVEFYSEERRPLEETVAVLMQFSKHQASEGPWITSDFYIQNTLTLTPPKTVSKAWHLETLTEMEYPLFSDNALMEDHFRYVITPNTIILNTSPEIHRYFGNSMRQSFLKEAF